MKTKIDINKTSATELDKATGLRLWYWPTLSQPYRVHTRVPGKPYHLHSSYSTEAEAQEQFDKLAMRQRVLQPVSVSEAAALLLKVA